jgi:hypothetical protein
MKSAQVRGSIAYAQLPKSKPMRNLMPYYSGEELEQILQVPDIVWKYEEGAEDSTADPTL